MLANEFLSSPFAVMRTVSGILKSAKNHEVNVSYIPAEPDDV